nr:hypothetical protein HmN_000478300 [Hymenolepis microstoma]
MNRSNFSLHHTNSSAGQPGRVPLSEPWIFGRGVDVAVGPPDRPHVRIRGEISFAFAFPTAAVHKQTHVAPHLLLVSTREVPNIPISIFLTNSQLFQAFSPPCLLTDPHPNDSDNSS